MSSTASTMQTPAQWVTHALSGLQPIHGPAPCWLAVVMEGRHTGLFKLSGKSLDAQVCHILRFQGGKLSSFQQYVDTGQLQTVMAAR